MPIITINDTLKSVSSTHEVTDNSTFVYDLNYLTTIRYYYNENNTIEYHSVAIDTDFINMVAIAAKIII
jgi:hypothetical protein